MVHMNLKNYDFSSLKICDSGGELLPLPIITKLRENTGLIITEGYGLTETSSLSHFLMPDANGVLRLGSVGQPCSGVMCKIIDKDGAEVGTYEPGELLIKGPLLMKGYDDITLNKDVFTDDGWFKTGDIFYKDEEDFYYFMARRKELNNQDLATAKYIREIGQLLHNLDDIQELFLVLQQNLSVTLFIKPTDPSNEFCSLLQEKIGKILYRLPLQAITYRFVNHIPRTASGKVKFNEKDYEYV
jgi:long-chain acyl-CoA synthetase